MSKAGSESISILRIFPNEPIPHWYEQLIPPRPVSPHSDSKARRLWLDEGYEAADLLRGKMDYSKAANIVKATAKKTVVNNFDRAEIDKVEQKVAKTISEAIIKTVFEADIANAVMAGDVRDATQWIQSAFNVAAYIAYGAITDTEDTDTSSIIFFTWPVLVNQPLAPNVAITIKATVTITAKILARAIAVEKDTEDALAKLIFRTIIILILERMEDKCETTMMGAMLIMRIQKVKDATFRAIALIITRAITAHCIEEIVAQEVERISLDISVVVLKGIKEVVAKENSEMQSNILASH